ncbi:MAG: adenosylmethionine--8-amino-7-oxononanoate transaminase [Magnetococcales bacterium]|nr:adenosylmethionine--8-amino-7-oxononanoate transaminase [Magnetococcales bacterium]
MNAQGNELVGLDRAHIWHPFTQEKTAPDPIPIASASGSVLKGFDDQEYLDVVSSWWVTTHGHAHPAIANAIAEQAKTLEQVIFAGFTHEPAARLTAALSKKLPGDISRCFFSDDGSTAVEVSLKMACQYWLNQGQKRTRFVMLQGGYHGDTVGAMSVGRSSGFFDAFANMLFHVDVIPFPDTWEDDPDVEQKEHNALADLDRYLDQHAGECAAVILEPLLQGASGMRMCRPVFIQKLNARLKEANILLIFDEVMTGFGRTGTLFASEKAGVTPDIICLSKGLTSGFLPMSITACTQEIYQAFLNDDFDHAFAHGHSFTANPLGCAAGLASLKLFETEQTLTKIAAIEAKHRERLDRIKDHEKVEHTRLIGSIAAFDVKAKNSGYNSEVGPILKKYFLERGLLIRPLGNVLYLLPPYCTSMEQLDRAWDGIEDALNDVV